MMVPLLLILRLAHILAGVFWAGAAFLMAWFIEPAVRASGDDGRRFMQRLAASGRFSRAMASSAGITVLAGLWLTWILFETMGAAFFETGRGLALALGMLLGVIAFVVGMVMQNRSTRRMAAIGRDIAAAGGPPSPAQSAEMEKLAGTVRRGGQIVSALLVVTVILMAIARYIPSF
jgi:uncharacterized membrane protein